MEYSIPAEEVKNLNCNPLFGRITEKQAGRNPFFKKINSQPQLNCSEQDTPEMPMEEVSDQEEEAKESGKHSSGGWGMASASQKQRAQDNMNKSVLLNPSDLLGMGLSSGSPQLRKSKSAIDHEEQPGSFGFLARKYSKIPDTELEEDIEEDLGGEQSAEEIYRRSLGEQMVRIKAEVSWMVSMTPEEVRPYLMQSIGRNRLTLSNKTLLLDLDDTLIHTVPGLSKAMIQHRGQPFISNTNRVVFYPRPGLFPFLLDVRPNYELIICTASNKVYAQDILQTIDPDNQYFDGLICKEDLPVYKYKRIVKDTRMVDRLPENIMVIDNEVSYWARECLPNIIPIKDFEGEKEDDIFDSLAKLLNKHQHDEDARDFIKNMFDFR